MVDRRIFLKTSIAAAVSAGMPMGWAIRTAGAAPAAAGLADPVVQFGLAGFVNPVPDAMAPGFKYVPGLNGEYTVGVAKGNQAVGLTDPLRGNRALTTPVWGYGDPADQLYTWPGRTFEVKSVSAGGSPTTVVNWLNELNPKALRKDAPDGHLLPVDTSLHWCYSLPGYIGLKLDTDGVPIITHLHGGHSDFQYDGNPEFFYNYNEMVVGPQWANVPGGFTTKFVYDNNVPAGNLWYHDHALGITRLNVYAGMAGFYFVRDEFDTGLPGNPLGLPAWPYEKAYAIQDRMFVETGELFYPAFPGDPYYDDFITGEGANLPPDIFPGGGPTALAEFFGDFMVVNGVIWPKEDVEPRNYRLHVLNGTDSRFMALKFYEVPAGATNWSKIDPFTALPTFEPDPAIVMKELDFTVVGSDQGLASAPTTIGALQSNNVLLSEPGSRYDIVVDFSQVALGNRVIMANLGGDEPFGGDIGVGQLYSHTDRIMAFDVSLPLGALSADPVVSPTGINFGPAIPASTRTRQVALFEGMDEFGRLQPLLGTAEPATDHMGNPVNWPNTPEYANAGLVGQMEGAIAWHSPTTENPALGSTEEWAIWNVTGDGHPIHLHLVKFEVLGREEIVWDSATTEDDRVLDPAGITAAAPNGDGTYLVEQPIVQHNGLLGDGFRIMNHTTGAPVATPAGVVENTPKDMVTALPGQVTRIKATFDKPGRYVWHCHILSHEDHEMMRVLHIGPGA